MLVQRTGPRILVLGSLSAVILGMLALTQLDADSSTLQVAATLFFFGIGAGLAETPLTDTVMAAVPVDDAGIGSAINDVSRELGGALGIALIGSIVNGFYRSNVADALAGQAPAEVIEAAQESVGVATITAAQLSSELASTVTAAVNQSFIDAIGAGFIVSIAFLIGGLAIAALMLPNRMRETQAVAASALQPAIAEAPPSIAPTGSVASGSVAAETDAT